MPTVLPDDVARFVELLAPERDETLAEMEAYNREREFPIVGPEVGGFLQVGARLAGAERIFEFGSGLGYSAYWFARALPPEGEVVLTDVDPDELETAREFFEQGGLEDRATFEAGDALETFGRYDGPFDVVLIDHADDEYVSAFEAAVEKMEPGGLIVADNVITGGGIDGDAILAALEGSPPEGTNDATAGIAEYLLHVRESPAVETIALPLGEGIAVSVLL